MDTIYSYRKAKKSTFSKYGNRSPVPVKPHPTERDYRRGFFTRYFAMERNPGTIIWEIDEKQYLSHSSVGIGINSKFYKVFSFRWKISGPEFDIHNKNGYPISNGVRNTNERTLSMMEEKYAGISRLLSDPLEYWEER